MAKATKKKAKKKRKESAEARKIRLAQAKHRRSVRTCLENIGFAEVKGIAGKHFTFDGTSSEFDDVYCCENVVVLVEYTSDKDLSAHIKKKKVLYDKIQTQAVEFHEFLSNLSEQYASSQPGRFKPHQLQFRVLYCCDSVMRPSLKDEVPSARILDLPLLYYFRTIASSILASAVHEFLEFLNIQPQEFGDRIIRPGSGSSKYAGSLLPDAHSNFGKGYRVVSFYIDPESLLSKCFVLRRSAWERAPNLYQRMISKKKIGQIRKYLVETERVFLNNIVVSLPSDVVILKDGEIIKEDLTRTKQVEVQLPDKPNTIGLIDGQHRVYSYHSGGSNEQKIGQLRRHLNLLVTGIIFPDSLSQEDRTRFEANLFLEINSTQTGAKSDLKQEIGLILYPSSGESIARRVIIKMGEVGPLAGLLSSAMLGARGVKTTTIVSYGLMPLLKLSGDDSIYSLLEKSAKESLIKNPSDEAIANYVDRATKEVNLVISAAKDAIGAVGWITVGSKGTLRITPTLINGLISYLRLAIQSKKKLSFEAHRAAMSKLLSVNPMSFKSSQYNRLGKAIFAAAYPASKGS